MMTTMLLTTTMTTGCVTIWVLQHMIPDMAGFSKDPIQYKRIQSWQISTPQVIIYGADNSAATITNSRQRFAQISMA